MRRARAARDWIALGASAVVLGTALFGCGDLADSMPGKRAAEGHAEIGGAVVSTVDGQPIVVGEVEALARATSLGPAVALRRLQDERVLRREVSRRGIEPDPETRNVSRQALVQALLEEEAAKVTVSEAELRAAYEARKDRFIRPERRRALHVLAFVPEDATAETEGHARAFATGVVRRLKDAGDVEAAWKSYVGAQVGELKIAAERIPSIDRNASLVRPFLDAMFGVSEPSVVPEPVRTSFGWHAIAVLEITPALDVPFEKAVETLRPEVLAEKRKAHLDELLDRLRREIVVTIEPSAGERLAEVGP